MTTMRAPDHSPRARQRGAALLTAMIIVTLVVTLSASMVWQQWRAVQVEVAERSRAQSAWILAGALDWARLILREDAKSGQPTSLASPWAVPLAEARLSSFLAADKDNNSGDDGPEAFLSGSISDAQSRYNVSNLVDGSGAIVETEKEGFSQLCQALGLPADVATRIATGLRDSSAKGTDGGSASAPLTPETVAQLSWFGIEAATIQTLEPFITVLGFGVKVNVNTAPREVLAAAIKGLDLATAERIVQARQRTAFSDTAAIEALIPGLKNAALQNVIFKSDYFEVRGRLRLSDRTLEQRSLVQREGTGRVIVKHSEKVSSREAAGP